jgi:5-methylcytosine-specific restriction protein A
MSEFWQNSRNKNNPVYKRFRKAILERDEYQCQIRGPRCLGQATVVDHIVPVNTQNMCDPSNCRAACRPCNSQKAGADRMTRARRLDPEPRISGWWRSA